MKFRAPSQHHKCTTCAQFTAKVKEGKCAPEELDKARAEMKVHLTRVLNDRAFDSRLDFLAEYHSSDILKIDMDFLDLAKCKLPRWPTPTAKSFEKLWRPSVHIGSIIQPGLAEHLVVQSPHGSKGSNNEITLLVNAIQGYIMAHGSVKHLEIRTDNTAKEAKNAHLFRFLAALVTGGYVRSTHLGFFGAGHSHGRCDRRFASVSEKLSQSSAANPSDVLEVLRCTQFQWPLEVKKMKQHPLPLLMEKKKI